MACPVLHHGVACVQRHLRAVVELQDDRALEYHFEVDGVRGVHPRIRRVHVSHQPRQLGLEVGQCLLGVEESLIFCADVGRNGEHAEPEPADRRKIAVPLRHRTVIGELRRRVRAPELVELGGRQ